ncbi:hypothetical protein FSP39_018292 [Pinctada imbricata]|uniref:Uncharacterized protein n=1 Tax=Pinctada imbricata TaxID=66713 RepID=A0AA88YIY3_PINIB|nr:hypothetical protein FSP39_018292 [Pinctada imbricata]
MLRVNSQKKKGSSSIPSSPNINASLPVSLPLGSLANAMRERSRSSENIFEKIKRAGNLTSTCTDTRRSEDRVEVDREQASTSRANSSDLQVVDKLDMFAQSISSSISSGFQKLSENMAASFTKFYDFNSWEDEYDSDSEDQMSDEEANEKKLRSQAPSITIDDLFVKKPSNESGSGDKSDGEKENKSKKNRTSKNELLDIISDQLTLKEATDDPVDEKLAQLVKGIMFKSDIDKKAKEQMKEAAEKVKRPQNCGSLTTTKVEELIWNRLQPSTRSQDIKFQEVQNFLVKGITVLVNTSNKIISNEQKDEISREEIVKEVMKAVELLSHANFELNIRRRECLKNDIDKEKYLGLFSQNVPVNEHLFGGDINNA